MKETAEMLKKHTRGELVEIAEKLGINTAGVAKMNIADSIIKARMTAEKPAAKEASKRAKASKAEVPRKTQSKPHTGMNIGKKGVFAKRAAISAQMGANAEAAAAIGAGVMEMQKSIRDMQTSIKDMTFGMTKFAEKFQQEGSAKLHKGVDEMQKSINAQIKLNEKAAAKMGTGIKEMHSGIKVIQNGIHEMETKFGEYRNETANYIRDFYYG
ncbi:Uncharacterised protein [uncultured archaeon]|nr:Uncharacterised protein [uncultured archaeon]